eukprot:1544347-Pyramimonas_sp.AAC.1
MIALSVAWASWVINAGTHQYMWRHGASRKWNRGARNTGADGSAAAAPDAHEEWVFYFISVGSMRFSSLCLTGRQR